MLAAKLVLPLLRLSSACRSPMVGGCRAAAADAIDGRRCYCSCCVVVTAAISYAVCGSAVVRAATAATAANAAGAQVPPAAEGEGSSYQRLLMALLCHKGIKYFPLTQFAVDRQLVKNIGRIN